MTVKPSIGSEKTAIILLGHGSRAAGAAEDMERVVARLKEELEYDIVDICQMSGLGDHFPETFDRCVNRGATKIMVVPYFLHFGVHLRQDVPEMMLEKAREYSHVKITLGKHLGFDDALVEVVKRRVVESERLDDIRELKIEPVDDCPCESRHHLEVG
ncbi:MAG: sirohydrochlorin chelatase [Armatimonadota bacterium]